MVKDHLNKHQVETTWYQPVTRVSVDFGTEDPLIDLAATGPNESKEVHKLVRQLLAPVSTRLVVVEPVVLRAAYQFTTDPAKKEKWRVHINSVSVKCPSPSVAARIVSLDPITSHAPYKITFKLHPENIHVDSCCTVAIRITKGYDLLLPLIEPFCYLVSMIFYTVIDGKHTFTQPVKSSFDEHVYLVTASNIYLAYFLTQLPYFHQSRFYFASVVGCSGDFIPNARQSRLLDVLKTHVEAMVDARKKGDNLGIANARRPAVEVLKKLATTAELFKIGEPKLTEATGRLERVQRDLKRMMSCETDMNLETITSACTRLQKSMAELRDAEIALARVEKWYRDTGENDQKKDEEEGESEDEVEHEEGSETGIEAGLTFGTAAQVIVQSIQDTTAVLQYPALTSQPARSQAQAETTASRVAAPAIKLVPAKRDAPDEDDDETAPLRPYKQPMMADITVTAQPINGVTLSIARAPLHPVTSQRAVPVEYMESLLKAHSKEVGAELA